MNDDLDKLDTTTLKMDKISLDDKAIVRFRKKCVWVVSFFAILIITALIMVLVYKTMFLVYAFPSVRFMHYST